MVANVAGVVSDANANRNEGTEPPHIHVKAAGDEAKFWLDPVQLCANYGFNGRELNEVRKLVVEHRDRLMEAWHEYFG